MKKILCSIFFLIATLTSYTQSIIYSEADNADSRDMSFDIIGKMNGNILVYKNKSNKNIKF